MSLAFSAVDVVVVLVVLASMAFAIWRGFIRETLTIFAWLAAALAALYFGPWAGHLASGFVHSPWLALLIGYAAMLTVVFIPLQFASHRIGQNVQRSPVGPLDRTLGGAFGAVRGLAILGLVYLVFTAVVPIRSQPHWVTTARTLPVVQASAEALADIVPDHKGGDVAAQAVPAKPDAAPTRPEAPQRKTAERADDTPHAAPAADPPAAKPRPKPGAKRGKGGYGVGERRALDRLFEATGDSGSGTR